MKVRKNMVYTCRYKSPLGEILLAADEIGLTGLWFEGQKYFANTLPEEYVPQETKILTKAKKMARRIIFPVKNRNLLRHFIPLVQYSDRQCADFTGDPLRTDDYIWRNCAQNGCDEKHFPYVRPGSRRCGWT